MCVLLLPSGDCYLFFSCARHAASIVHGFLCATEISNQARELFSSVNYYSMYWVFYPLVDQLGFTSKGQCQLQHLFSFAYCCRHLVTVIYFFSCARHAASIVHGFPCATEISNQAWKLFASVKYYSIYSVFYPLVGRLGFRSNDQFQLQHFQFHVLLSPSGDCYLFFPVLVMHRPLCTDSRALHSAFLFYQ